MAIQYSPFTVSLRTQAEWDAATALGYTHTFSGVSPSAVAAALGIPLYIGTILSGSSSYVFVYNGTYFPSPTQTSVTVNPGDLSTYDGRTSVAVTTDFGWIGHTECSLNAAAAPGPPPPGPPITQPRRWVEGFELGDLGEGGSGTPFFCRDASRTSDGLGYAFRRSAAAANISHTLTTLGAAASARSWERFYVRLRNLPAANMPIWRARGAASAQSGGELYVTPTGTLRALNLDPTGVSTGTIGETASALDLDTWYRVDLLIIFGSPAAPEVNFQLYLNGTVEIAANAGSGSGLGASQNHASSQIGDTRGTVNTLEVDFDDWHNAAYPTDFAFTTTEWTSGSHLQLVRATGLGASSSANWVGNYRVLVANPTKPVTAAYYLEASVAASQLAVTTDVPVTNPIAAVLVALYNVAGGGAGDAQLGYSIDGAAAALTAITTTTGVWNQIIATPSSADPPLGIATLELIHKKDNAAGVRRVSGLFAVVELLGSWGPEDSAEVPGLGFPSGAAHNAPYPSIAAALAPVLPPTGSDLVSVGPLVVVALESGTYVGNNTGQSLSLEYPPHWIWIRALTGDQGGVQWWSSIYASHNVLQRGVSGVSVPRSNLAGAAWNATTVFISGTDAQVNATGVTYQWVSVSDPGMRFLYNGANRAADTAATYVQDFPDTGYTAVAGFFLPEEEAATTTKGVRYKGVGCAVDDAILLSNAGSTVQAAATFGAGSLTTRTALHGTINQAQDGYSLWRPVDGSGTADRLFDTVSYVGNGAASRVIACDLGGNYPLWALIVPHDGTVAYMRDPSHTGSNSSNTGGGNSTTAITAGGTNSLTVGVTLNTLGVTYDVFVLRGQLSGWFNGSAIVLTPAQAPGTQFLIDRPGAGPEPPEPECRDSWGNAQPDGLPYVPLLV